MQSNRSTVSNKIINFLGLLLFNSGPVNDFLLLWIMKPSIDFVNIEVPCGSWMIKHFTNIIIGTCDRATFLNYSPFVNGWNTVV